MPRGGANGLYPISITERTQESQQQGVCLDLYLHPENPKQDVNPEAVGQGLIGDCYFLASLASVASSNPELIVKMITDKLNRKDNTVGLLLNDPSLYNNLNATTANAASLLEDLKSHPKRYVHFSLFGKKDK